MWYVGGADNERGRKNRIERLCGSSKPIWWGGVLANGGASPGWAESPDAAPWYRQALVGIEVGPTGAQWGDGPRNTAYASLFNGRGIIEAAHKAGAGMLN